MKSAKIDYPLPSSPKVTKVMRANRRSNTGPEKALGSGLHRLGYRFRKDVQVPTRARRCRPDIVFSKKRLAIFIDGCFWHRCHEHGCIPKSNRSYWLKKFRRNALRDRADDVALKKAGWAIMRIWEHESPDSAIKRIRSRLAKIDQRTR